MARRTTDHDMERAARRHVAEMVEYEAERLFQLAVSESRLTPDDFAPGCDAHDRYMDDLHDREATR